MCVFFTKENLKALDILVTISYVGVKKNVETSISCYKCTN